MKVLTVTLNPALDRELIVDDFKINEMRRIRNQKYSKMEPGGKGINVSLILSGLGIPSIAMGFLGGFIGAVVERRLREASDIITSHFCYVDEETRENIAIIDQVNDTITEINSSGPLIDERTLDMLKRRYEITLNRVKSVVISGSAPPGVPEDYYEILVSRAKELGKTVIGESTGKHFEKALKQGHYTVAKPDLRSNKELFGKELNELDDYVEAAQEIIKYGNKMAIVSYEIEGDIIATEEGVWFMKTKTRVEQSHLFGTGDSFVAGAAYSLLENERELLEAAKVGMAAAVTESRFVGKEFFTAKDIHSNMDTFDVSRLR
ncbi:MAG: 1-phosphofructokinase family hexose kinase [Kosmotogaceae bacterium]